MNYKENFENLRWDGKPYRPISDFSYSVMKAIGSITSFVYKTNKNLEDIHYNINKEVVTTKIVGLTKYEIEVFYRSYRDIYLNIKTFWNMIGSMMLPIRNSVQNINEIYTIFQKYLNIDVLNEIEFPSFNKKYKELGRNGKKEYSNKFIESFGYILNSLQQIQILSHINREKISDINWSFKEFMDITLNKINTLNSNYTSPTISVFKMIEKILENLKFNSEEEKTNSMNILLNCEIKRFIVALINSLIYKSYEKMTEKFMNEISYFNDVIKGQNDLDENILSNYEIKQIEEK